MGAGQKDGRPFLALHPFFVQSGDRVRPEMSSGLHPPTTRLSSGRSGYFGEILSKHLLEMNLSSVEVSCTYIKVESVYDQWMVPDSPEGLVMERFHSTGPSRSSFM